MEDNPLLLSIFQRAASDRRVWSISCAALKDYEPKLFEQSIEFFLCSMIGKMPSPVQRLQKWCELNGYTLTDDFPVLTITPHE